MEEVASSHFVSECENTGSDRSAGVKWEVTVWAAGVISSGFSGFQIAETADASLTVMYTQIHTQI